MPSIVGRGLFRRALDRLMSKSPALGRLLADRSGGLASAASACRLWPAAGGFDRPPNGGPARPSLTGGAEDSCLNRRDRILQRIDALAALHNLAQIGDRPIRARPLHQATCSSRVAICANISVKRASGQGEQRRESGGPI
jgi:hypothetical protein